MKNEKIKLIVFCIIITAVPFVFLKYHESYKIIIKPKLIFKSSEKSTSSEKNWKKLIESIIMVESANNDSAINYGGCVGCMQITPIYIKEVNRINRLYKNPERYKLSDRYDRKKCIEMFNILQSHRNPTKDIHKAIRLHNPTAGKWYEDRIMKLYNLS